MLLDQDRLQPREGRAPRRVVLRCVSGTQNIDVLVVGLGPAGACAAEAAAMAGASVIAIERNRKPGLPVQCAEFIPLMLGAGIDGAAALRVQPIERMETFVADEARDITPDFPGMMVDRAAFDRHLIDRAIAAGATCRYGTPLRALSPDGIATLADGTEFAARIIIGADGPRSPVGAAIGVPNTELVETRQITLDLLETHTGTDIFLRPEIVGGYGWLFPKGNLCNLGLGVVPEHKDRLKPLLDSLHAELVDAGRVGRTIHRTTGGAIPVGGMVGPVGRLDESTALLAGDAAGLTNPVTGAGINAAVMSGRLAGDAAAQIASGDTDAAADYADEIEALFGTSLALAVRRRRELLAEYHDDHIPDPGALRRGWIAYPQYWTPHTGDAA